MLRFEKALFENVGPIERMEVSAGFDEGGLPRPLVLVGKNGTGKTLVLAHMADALVEFARVGFTDIENSGPGLSHRLFKVCGPSNQRSGAPFALAGVRFADGGRVFRYFDKTGHLDSGTYSPPDWLAGLSWSTDGNDKKQEGAEQKWAQDTLLPGVFAFFPASRREIPHWINPDSKYREHPTERFRFTGVLGKPLIVESAATENRDWLLDVMLDSMAEIEPHPVPGHGAELLVRGNIPLKMLLRQGRKNIERLLQEILEDGSLGLSMMARNASQGRIAITRGDSVVVPSLGNLSSGEALLFSLFLTVMRYADVGNITRPSLLETIEGTVIIDEVDAHLHADLQHDLLPRLLKLFPRVQWIISTHSPLFLLGMRKTYGAGDLSANRCHL